MKKMKFLNVFLLCGVLVLAMLTGCTEDTALTEMEETIENVELEARSSHCDRCPQDAYLDKFYWVAVPRPIFNGTSQDLTTKSNSPITIVRANDNTYWGDLYIGSDRKNPKRVYFPQSPKNARIGKWHGQDSTCNDNDCPTGCVQFEGEYYCRQDCERIGTDSYIRFPNVDSNEELVLIPLSDGAYNALANSSNGIKNTFTSVSGINSTLRGTNHAGKIIDCNGYINSKIVIGGSRSRRTLPIYNKMNGSDSAKINIVAMKRSDWENLPSSYFANLQYW